MAAKAKATKKRSPRNEVKEMRYSVRIGPGDFDTKTRKVDKFLRDGHRVKVTIRFRRGREMSRTEFGRKMLDRIVEQLDAVRVESQPRLDGTFMSMLLAPDPARERADLQHAPGLHGVVSRAMPRDIRGMELGG